ncbi:hypothetical protein CJJ19_01280 [Candidatus Williamhamiltonella defendens]|nr:hypothetical protein [Candidatus Hamiltonella defensa]AYB48369.1 hypothetical protein CJJ19_01280 [Candidatus Hamiltonella defensa]
MAEFQKSIESSKQRIESYKRKSVFKFEIQNNLKAKNDNDQLLKEKAERKRESLKFNLDMEQLKEKNKAVIAKLEKPKNNILKNQRIDEKMMLYKFDACRYGSIFHDDTMQELAFMKRVLCG